MAETGRITPLKIHDEGFSRLKGEKKRINLGEGVARRK